MDFIFEESDIIIQTIDLQNYIKQHKVEFINKYQELIVKIKNRDISKLNLNNISSNFLQYDFSKNYFISNAKKILHLKIIINLSNNYRLR